MARLTVTFRQNVAMLRTSREEALTDALTELGNRRALSRRLDWAIANAVEHGETLVLVLFDLDGFKHYNDTFGHPAGDALLMRLGRRLEAFMGDRGQAFRMGGDEFCALFCTDVRSEEVAGAAEALSERGERTCSRAKLRMRRARCGSPTSACTRRSTRAACRPATRARRCCCAR
jgi:diguanylate cyclase (GGDEF)-like protein